MKRETREQIIDVVRPFFLALSFVVKVIHKVLFGWLELWFQKRENDALERDLQANLYFLYSAGEIVKERWTTVHPFDYAVVRVNYGNIQFIFTRGQGDLNVTLLPLHAPSDTYQLYIVVAALDSKETADVAQHLTNLTEVGDLLRARLEDVNAVFSESQYPEFKKKLLLVKEQVRVLTRQAEWELNRTLYH